MGWQLLCDYKSKTFYVIYIKTIIRSPSEVSVKTVS